jgi:TonB family protein
MPFVMAEAHPPADLPPRDRGPGGFAVVPTWTSADRIPDLGVSIATPTLPGVTDLLADIARSAGPGRPELATDAGGAAELRTATSVDEPVAVIDQPMVTYPRTLAHAGISGRVELEYVVDTSGRAERGSVRALVSTRPEFEAAARATVLASRFRPARLRGHVVRQVVRQTLSFRAEQ